MKFINNKYFLFAIGLYSILIIFLYFFQRNIQYLPFGKVLSAPEGFEKINITTQDNVKLFAWYGATKKGGKVIIYFHGNAGNLGDRTNKYDALYRQGFGVLALSYRGYYGSEGKPSEKGLINDAEAAKKFLNDQGFDDRNIILYGESLGTGVAVQLASKYNFNGIFLESPYTSIYDIAKRTYWYAPVSLILKDRFESIKYIALIKSPIMIMHGTNDKIVPFEHGKKMFDTATSRKKFLELQNANHLEVDPEFFSLEIKNFFNQ